MKQIQKEIYKGTLNSCIKKLEVNLKFIARFALSKLKLGMVFYESMSKMSISGKGRRNMIVAFVVNLLTRKEISKSTCLEFT